MRFAATLVIIATAFAALASAGAACPYAAAAAGELVNDETFIRAAFAKFQKDHVKLYASNGSAETRYQFFRSNYLRALELNQKLNAERGTTGLKAHGVTEFMDLSPEEMRNRMGYVRSNADLRRMFYDSAKPAPADSNGEPTEFNWPAQAGVETRARQQGDCGSCWAYSAVTAIESAVGVRDRNNTKTSYLSPQQLVDCDPVSHGCRGGDLPPAFNYLKGFGGSISEKDYPYTGVGGSCKAKKSAIDTDVLGFEWAIKPCEFGGCDKQSESDLSKRIAERGPAAICVAATNDWFTYTGPDAYSADCANDYYSLNHCITLDALERDAKDGKLYWYARNSWGDDWGVRGGFIKLAYGVNRCGLADEAAFPVLG